jgi:hypothetical protein
VRGNFYNRNHNADMCVGLKKCKSFVYGKKRMTCVSCAYGKKILSPDVCRDFFRRQLFKLVINM